jgi:hypothetical protein
VNQTSNGRNIGLALLTGSCGQDIYIDIDCLYGLCAEGACKLPSKLCPSSSSSSLI